jgi:hypothetical protein
MGKDLLTAAIKGFEIMFALGNVPAAIRAYIGKDVDAPIVSRLITVAAYKPIRRPSALV